MTKYYIYVTHRLSTVYPKTKDLLELPVKTYIFVKLKGNLIRYSGIYIPKENKWKVMKNEKEKQEKRVQVLDRNVTHCTTYIYMLSPIFDIHTIWKCRVNWSILQLLHSALWLKNNASIFFLSLLQSFHSLFAKTT